LADVPLAPLTTLRLGGPATRMVEAETEAELVDAVASGDAAAEPILVLAGGSNVVIADAGFTGTVVRVATRGVASGAAGDRVELTVAAGEPWDGVVERIVAEGLAGLECLSGIPGSTGATPIQNVGAYGQEVSATVAGVRVYDRATGTVATLPPGRCAFTYRGSAFRHRDRHVVLSVTFSLARSDVSVPIRYAELARTLGVAVGDRAPLAEVRVAVLGLRRAKGMVVDPSDPDSVSAGSFFTNPILDADGFADLQRRAATALGAGGPAPPGFPEPGGRVKTSAAWLIEQAGFAKGHGAGAIRLSDKHTLAITNRGGGTTAELIALARELREGVRATFGVTLVPEPVLVGVEL
jgi:UDP-N-acetylmuramate dehydrogenase